MCQNAREKYWLDYEEKYSKKINKFNEEIKNKSLLDNCEAREFAEQLCMVNYLKYL